MTTDPTLTVDNLTGLGPLDYTAVIAAPDGAATPLQIVRALNQPSTIACLLDLTATTLPVPLRRGRIVISAANGTVLFTGYLATEPSAIYSGTATVGAVFRYHLSAISDEWLLDKQPLPYLGNALGVAAGNALLALTQRTLAGLFSTSGVSAGRTVGVFEPQQSGSWSINAAALAGSAYAAYRVLNGGVILQPAGTVTHAFDFDTSTGPAATVSFAALKTSAVKELANDVTL